MKKPVALVTGATRGLGFALAKALSENGYTVYGTSREPEKYQDFQFMQLLKLDLSDVNTIKQLHGELPTVDLLVNSAGFSQIGTVEEISPERMKHLFDVNLFNQIILTQKYIPSMREKRAGAIINITSMAGTTPVPFSTIYALVKGAFDSFSKGLRNELFKYGIKVVAVAPFQMDTTIPQQKDYADDTPYMQDLLKAKNARDRALSNSEDPNLVASQIVKILKMKNPPAHISAGKGSWRKEWLIRHLPKRMVERMVRRRFDLDY